MIPKTVIMRGGEYKCRIFKVHLKLRDQQLKTIIYIHIYIYTHIYIHTHVYIYVYIYRLLYKNLMVTTNQKSIIDIHTKKEEESKHNTKDSHQITREQKKR